MNSRLNACLERLNSHGLPMIPQQALAIHAKLEAPPRLLAHHFLVHQAAATLVSKLTEHWQNLKIDENAVLFGAATHDIGKAEVRRELSEPGCDHEILGFALLMENSIPLQLARFTKDHGLGQELEGLEDLLVCVADKCWKGKREEKLECSMPEPKSPGSSRPQ